ncbi:hypothetical protein FRB99_002006 [Tulasnella sp. 403]|nr:hypothetical protein FRB99_002006 [Tulasnella sp. 403]
MTTNSDKPKDTWSAALYNTNASFVYSPNYTADVLSLLAAKGGEKILDLGCGSGEVTLTIEKLVGERGLSVGTDFSKSMIDKAKENGLKHAFVADAQALSFPSELAEHEGTFDAVFTNATLHWCKRDPAGVLRSVKRALRKDGRGRFVGEFGGYLNCVGVRGALKTVLKARGYNPEERDPWFFPSVEYYRQLLEAEGFRVDHISLNPRLTPLPGELLGWLRTFCRDSWLEDLGDQEAEDIMNEVQEKYAIDGKDEFGKWAVMYVRLRFAAGLV